MMLGQSSGSPIANSSSLGIAQCANAADVRAELNNQSRYISPWHLKYALSTCAAWVNFGGSGTVAIRESYNVSLSLIHI